MTYEFLNHDFFLAAAAASFFLSLDDAIQDDTADYFDLVVAPCQSSLDLGIKG